MKIKLFLLFFTILLTTGLVAQESITNIVVTPKTDGSGIVDVYYDLGGSESSYEISLEVSFDAGNNFAPVDNTCITGDIGSVAPGTGKYLIWDGICSNPETYSIQAKIKIIATSSGGNCGEPITDSRDGQTYNTLQIGTQCWMAENLNVGTRIDGANEQTNNSQIEKYCYNDDPANCTVYGGLYQWDEMMQYVTTEGAQGICPTGWHLPTDDEWKTMEMHLGMTQAQADVTQYRGTDEGGKLKEIGTNHWNTPNTGATNTSDFTAIPGGYSIYTGSFGGLGSLGVWWTTTETSTTRRWNRALGFDEGRVNRNDADNVYGFSVRCLKNEQNQPPTLPDNPVPADGELDVELSTILSWTCTDPENDPLTYDVYFGDSNPPLLISSNQSNTTYDPVTLNLNTSYYWQIIAHDDQTNQTTGSVWSFTTTETISFQCGGSITDIDGNIYTTSLIGEQCWMAENLNTTKDASGTSITRYCYDNNTSNCDSYGGLYDWETMMNGAASSNGNPSGVQGICPNGWHMPSDAEWTELVDYMVSQGYPNVSIDPNGAGNALKSCRQVNSPLGGDCNTTAHPRWNAHDTHYGTDVFGFSSLPGGFRNSNGTFDYVGGYGGWWSATQRSSSSAYYRDVYSNNGKVYRYDYLKALGFSVRCLKN